MTNYDDRMALATLGDTIRERKLMLIGGGALTLFGTALGLVRRSPFGVMLAAMGGVFIYRSVTGHTHRPYLLTASTPMIAEPEPTTDHQTEREHVTAVITIDYPIEKLYDIWRNFEQLPRILSSIESVTVLDETRSRWTTKPVGGFKVSWDAEIINDVPNQVIAWQSFGDSRIANAGSVRFRRAPYDKGTEMRVTLEYAAPDEYLDVTAARWLGVNPEYQLRDDLERFKAYIEQGRFNASVTAWEARDETGVHGQGEISHHNMPNTDDKDIENINHNM